MKNAQHQNLITNMNFDNSPQNWHHHVVGANALSSMSCLHYVYGTRWNSLVVTTFHKWARAHREIAFGEREKKWYGMRKTRTVMFIDLVKNPLCIVCTYYCTWGDDHMPPTKWQPIRTMSLPCLFIHEWAFIGSSRAIEKREHQINQTKPIIIYRNTYEHKNQARNSSPFVLHMPIDSRIHWQKKNLCGLQKAFYCNRKHGKCLPMCKECTRPQNRAIEANIRMDATHTHSIELQSLAKIIATYGHSIFKHYFMLIGLYFYMSLHITEIKQSCGSRSGGKRKRISCEKSQKIFGNIGNNKPNTTTATAKGKHNN